MYTPEYLLELIKEEFPFKSFQNNQLTVIFKILNELVNQDKKYFILEAPTGIGKSVIAYTVGKVYTRLLSKEKRVDTSTTVLTKTRQLQVQYKDSFIDMMSLWSSKNYPCVLNPSSSTVFFDENCMKYKCPQISNCAYPVARQAYVDAEIKVTNYAYYTESLGVEDMQTDLLVFDEAHSIEKVLCDRFTILVDSAVISEFIEFLNTYKMLSEFTQEFCNGIASNFKRLFHFVMSEADKDFTFLHELEQDLWKVLVFISNTLDENKEEKKYSSRMITKFESFKSIMGKIHQNLDVFNRQKDISSYVKMFNKTAKSLEVMLKPIKTEYLFSLVVATEKVLFMSATICGVDEFAKDLGISKDSYSSLSLNSPFPVANRQIHFRNLTGLNYQNVDSLMLEYVRELDNIMRLHPKDHGIVHTVSYKIAEAVLEYSEFSDRFIIPSKGQLFDFSVLDEIPSSVLLSPAMTEGVDLKDDLSRFQVIFKIPAPNLGDKWIKTKFDQSKNWYARETVVTIVQSYGRSIRHANDTAETYILDGSFSRLMHSEFLPKYFKGAIVK